MRVILSERYPIDRSKKVGAKPRNIEVSRDKRPVDENNGRTIEKPMEKQIKQYPQITTQY